ncbi:A disintegrin and metalloproteinase with thrombospondin motifs 3-like [Ptychodera flava]|uniref:A disintegrin and metalloproteinase with thrombospondin motifs 3-like n=1 Tax=Ptychodera flava TaxID=63121 RepID=UPI003969EA11
MKVDLSLFIVITAFLSVAAPQVHGGVVPNRLHAPGIDHFSSKLSDFEVTVPYLSTPDGGFISHRLAVREATRDDGIPSKSESGARSRRSPLEGEADKDSLHFSVNAFGSEFTLNVHRNSHLLAPQAKIEWTTVDGDFAKEENIDKDCFYIGDVMGTPGSSVAISNCNGLAGLIQVGGEDYFIEPLEKNVTSQTGDQSEGGMEHVMYKRSAIKPRERRESGDFEVASPHSLGEASALLGDSVHQRVRRSTGEKNIEVLLTADHSVVDFHGTSNIQLYLLTLMNIVNNIYKHPTLGTEINIVLVRIILLEASQGNLIVLNNPSKSLENVCKWANAQKTKENPHHDHAIFLSRQVFGPAGYAPVTGMCHLYRSCTLNQEDGLSSAFVVAHETGHVLGMEHDGQGNTCLDEANAGSIMAPLVQANFNSYFWSTCSKSELSNYLDAYTCLDDDPFQKQWPEVNDELPGLIYSADDQCRFDFGDGYKFCEGLRGISMCQQLWCTHPDSPLHCKTKKGPPLAGTSCGVGMYCLDGECVESTIEVVHGGWGDWSDYSECSRTCGVGAQLRTRECNNPEPSNSGDDCKGKNVEFRLCNTQDCPNSNVDYRAEQCKSNYQNWRYNNKKYTWLPHENADKSLHCKLTCIALENDEVRESSYNVLDGTKCSYDDPNPDNVCVQGQCQTVGCDKVLGSSLREDRCGVCGGNGSECENVSDYYSKVPRKNVQRIVTLPKGARHIDVFETSPSVHNLAVKEKVTGRYILRNDGKHRTDTTFVVAGTNFHYSVRGNRERLEARGPLQAEVVILVQSQSSPSERNVMNVSHKYIIRKQKNVRHTNRIPGADSKFKWVEMGWSQCSKPCDGGEQYFRYICQRKRDGKAVSKTSCDAKEQPEQQRKRRCNTQPCERVSYDWVAAEWEHCSRTCGGDGTQLRTVNCMKTQYGVTTLAHHRNCKGEKPTNKQPCNRKDCPAYWQTGEWQECSVTCGGGTQKRAVVCGYPNRKKVKWQCDQYPRPEDTRSCNEQSCAEAENKCLGDKSIFCSLEVLAEYCSLPGYSALCCRTCNDMPGKSQAP